MTIIASFDVDAQKCFTELCPNELPVENGHHIVEELNKNAQYAQYRLGSKDAHPANAIWVTHDRSAILTPFLGKEADTHWPVHAVPGTLGFELLDGLPHPSDYDYFVWKGVEPDIHPYGACFHDLSAKRSTGAIEFLQQHKVSTVIVGGLATDFCVKVTALQLLDAGFAVILNLAACRAIAKNSNEQALSALHNNGAFLVENAEEIPHALQKIAELE